VDPADMSEDDARVVVRSGGLNVFRALANAPTLLRPWMRLGHRILAETELDPRLREMVILYVGTLQNCRYEVAQHEPIALSLGARDTEVAAVLRGDLSGLGADDRTVLELVAAAVREASAEEAEVAAVRDILGDRGLVELMMTVASYMGLAALLNVLDVDVDEEARLQLRPRG
jgi:AhpD family alkylhydroperoxidase